MIDLNYHQASEVSNNILATHEALDDALLKLSALTQSMVHASRGAGMSAGKSQKALEAISEGLSGLMVSRRCSATKINDNNYCAVWRVSCDRFTPIDLPIWLC